MKEGLIILAMLVVVLYIIRGGYLANQESKVEEKMVDKTEVMSAQGGSALGGEDGNEDAIMEKKDGDTMMEKEIDSAMEEKKMVSSDGSLKLSVKAQGSGKVMLSWVAPANLDDSNRFILIRDAEEENPEHTELNYWIRQNHTQSEVVWNDVPEGTWHFRMCLTENNEKDTCTKYSNSVEVEVK